MAQFDDDKPDSLSLRETKDGWEIVRRIPCRGETVLEARASADIPARGTPWTIYTGVTVYVQDVNVDPVDDAGVTEDGFLYEAVVNYKSPSRNSNPVQNTGSWRLSVGQTTQRILHVNSEADAQHWPQSESWPGLYNGTGINVTDEGVEGVDIEGSEITLTIDVYMTSSEAETEAANCVDLAQKVNSGTFAGPWGSWAAGTVRYRGCEIFQVDGELAQVSHTFIYSPNVDVDVYLDTIDGEQTISKGGHEYLWVRQVKYTDENDETKNRTSAVDAHLNTVYEEASFSAITIPSQWIY